MSAEVDREALQKLRDPFPSEQIGKLPKGGIFLDFVGHGFLTARFLDVDPEWSWEPFALAANGLPLLDEFGGLWIRLTIAGKTRIGYGDAGGKTGHNAVKEAIGDALRNAGMRFGAALDFWCKGDPDAPTHERSAPDPRLEEANEARGDMLTRLLPYGWSPDKLIKRFKDDYNSDLLAADTETVKAFAAALEAEAKAQDAK